MLAKRVLLGCIVLSLLVIGMLPVLTMLIKSLIVDGHFSLASYQGLLTSSQQWTLMGHSMELASSVTLLTVAVGMPLGVLLAKTDLPWRGFFTVLFVIPLLIPPYIIAVSWSDFLAREGLLAHLLGVPASVATSHLLFALPGRNLPLCKGGPRGIFRSCLPW